MTRRANSRIALKIAGKSINYRYFIPLFGCFVHDLHHHETTRQNKTHNTRNLFYNNTTSSHSLKMPRLSGGFLCKPLSARLIPSRPTHRHPSSTLSSMRLTRSASITPLARKNIAHSLPAGSLRPCIDGTAGGEGPVHVGPKYLILSHVEDKCEGDDPTQIPQNKHKNTQ